MNINVDSLNNGFTKEVTFDDYINLPKSDSYDDSVFISCKGTLTNANGKYTFQGEVLANVVFYCSSCLEQFESEISFPILEVFSKEVLEDDEIWSFSGKNIISLEEPIKTNLLLNLPMKAMCSKNCKGLCRICGHNLNLGECGCERDFIDPRFEKFLHLFNNKEV